MLRQRIITALVLLPLAILAILRLDSAAFALLLGGIILVGAGEWCRLTQVTGRLRQVGFIALVALALWWSWLHLADAAYMQLMLWVALGWWLLALLWVLVYPRGDRYWYGQRSLRVAAGLLVLVPTWTALVSLQAAPLFGPQQVLFLMVLIWVADSGAFFTGRKLGRHKLSPKVSPGKSWEGVAGGLVAAVLVAWWVTGQVDVGIHFGPSAALSVIALILFSVLGDLTESMYKRHAGVKDSGHLLPGHGGVLDRIDSLTAAAPIFLLLLTQGWL